MSDQEQRRAPDAPSTAAEAFDPVAFARRVDAARGRRTEAIARRKALVAGAEPGGVADKEPGAARPPVPDRAAPARRSLIVFCFGLCCGLAAAVVAAQLLEPSRPAPAASFDVAVLPAATGSSLPAMPAAAARFAAPSLPEQAPDPRAVAGLDKALSPLARPDDLVILADTARVTGGTRGGARLRASGRGDLPPGIPRLVGRLLDEAARTTAGAVRDLRRLAPQMTARHGRIELRPRAGARPLPAATRSTRGRGRN